MAVTTKQFPGQSRVEPLVGEESNAGLDDESGNGEEDTDDDDPE